MNLSLSESLMSVLFKSTLEKGRITLGIMRQMFWKVYCSDPANGIIWYWYTTSNPGRLMLMSMIL